MAMEVKTKVVFAPRACVRKANGVLRGAEKNSM
ncbi:hypothetical protein PF005_g11362 [Phytophthora fragariae]|uniref:Uncharacterized protein n=2 Tax=Phytophthora TaxID=4783 RepID=A0A6A3TZS4_9STRA|nr:hypothetical protein PF003_g39285 [Phytophthora fragariae]KAE9334242.1 hypothetical protein PR003_g13613 [Phytophthora rubi]KAE8937356.1 hypothetical protein PF009_g12740 [Phytophthora fragariae]KAE9008133.1 hypothetical protein PF011_g10820 [Phytophthora fragariae]KAE9109591.1 hypothetical protein PF007_g12185 [Phytophthora fragariae]